MNKLLLLPFETVSERPTIIELEDGNSLSFTNRIHQIAIDPSTEKIEGLNFRFQKPQILLYENNLDTYVDPNPENSWEKNRFEKSDIDEDKSLDFVVDQNFSYYEFSFQGEKFLIILTAEIVSVYLTGYYKEDGEPVYWVKHTSNLSISPLTGDDLTYINQSKSGTNRKRRSRKR